MKQSIGNGGAYFSLFYYWVRIENLEKMKEYEKAVISKPVFRYARLAAENMIIEMC